MKTGNNELDIRLEAREILDRVDDMLAWEAIASESVHQFVWSHFCRADPLVRLDAKTWGTLTPTSLVVPITERELEESERIRHNTSMFEFFDRTAPEYLERASFKGLSYASLTEVDSQDIVAAKIGNGPIGDGDNVTDRRFDAKEWGEDGWWGARYHLESIGEMPSTHAREYVSIFKLPQVARVFLHQHVLAFPDGRAAKGASVFAYWNRQFFNLEKKPLRLRMADGSYFHTEQFAIGQLIYAQLRRETNWTVELALGKKRTGIGLETDAIGARELANMLRGSDTSAGRRKTLVHWVDEHMRRRRALDEQASIKVRAHFRGQNRIDAGRYHLRIWPSIGAVDRACNGARYDLSAEH